jgi:hypothetical protein
MQLRKILYSFFKLIFSLQMIYGCAHVPSTPIKLINKVDGKICVTLYDSYRRHQTHIKVLDDEKLSLVKKIDIENFGTSPVISNTFENNNSLLIWLTLTNIVMPLESAI